MTYFYFPRECDNYYTKNSFTRFSAKCRVAVNGSQLCYSQNSSKFHASENSFKNFGGLKGWVGMERNSTKFGNWFREFLFLG